MFKPTAALLGGLRRLPLTTKQVPRGYYKGNRTGAMGRHTKHGRYVLNYMKIRTYVVPNLEDFVLTPFVTKRIERPKGYFEGESPTSARLYLQRWKQENGYT
ncbi:mitochondrial ribosomal protein L27-domain-containing protein [Lineolata rhizophorae]|uniref:Mitochondrial ribosomal protein L27-domain-containing protein n=1 Tax=Lineolata rhizophorae TaxID=578093 RepID=A0A6A6P973_9PEZI|nr:mitochondrial ribosomal protein L27-domain-containing protein [Lineolata rhizophorae]